jgi:hypothetical protein
MKAISCLLLPSVMTWLFLGVSSAEDELSQLAASKRSACLLLTIDISPIVSIHSDGVFISDDGLALVSSEAVNLSRNQKPAIVTADGSRLEFGTVLGIFPDQSLALIKFNHRPKSWLRIAPEEPSADADAGAGDGDAIALITVNREVLLDGKVPPLVGQIIAKRSESTQDLHGLRFSKILSLGASPSREQLAILGTGSAAINRDGDLVACLAGWHPQRGQLLIHLTPVTSLVDQVKQAVARDKPIPFPLPDAYNTSDLVVTDVDWMPMIEAIQRRDRVSCMRISELTS